MRFLDIPRIAHSVKPLEPLPLASKKFDLISAIAVTFNHQADRPEWAPAEWRYFLQDAGSHLNPGGRIFLAFAYDLESRPELSQSLRAADGFEAQALSKTEIMLTATGQTRADG